MVIALGKKLSTVTEITVVMLLVLLSKSAYAQAFAAVGGMPGPTLGATATQLGNGTVLVAGGQTNNSPAASIYNPQTGAFAPTSGSMVASRQFHTATFLPNGQVLIAGGTGPNGPLASAELYSPSNGTFSATGSMITARYGATATLLEDGLVLIAGGQNLSQTQPSLSSAELYNPATGTFASAGNMNQARYGHSATLLPDGSVLVVGGWGLVGGSFRTLNSTERYVPSSGHFSTAGVITTARGYHTATLLGNGSVLIAGGVISNTCCTVTAAAELYNPISNTSAATGSLNTARAFQSATQLLDGTVLIAGGENSGNNLASAEIYTLSSKAFTSTASMTTARYDQTAVLLNNGSVLVAGGDNASAEIYSYPFTAGTMAPKYIVVGIMYAPPGSKSSVTYTQSTAMGTSTSFTNSLTNGGSVNTSIGLSAAFPAVDGSSGGSTTGMLSTQWSQEADTLSTYSLNKTVSNTLGVAGPVSNVIGVDHDYDLIGVWLNPLLNVSVGPLTTSIQWQGYSFNALDTNFPDGPDIVWISLYCLKNPFLSPNCTDNSYRTARYWDSSGNGGGLNLADFASIAARDPFYANPLYDPASDSTYRFLDTGTPAQYPLPPPGDGQFFGSGTYSYQVTSTNGKGATDSYSVTYSLSSAGLKTALESLLNGSSSSLSWSNKWSDVETYTAGQQAQWTIYGPLATDNYSGPTAFEVYQDNVYGTFMFYAPGQQQSNPGSIAINPGGTIELTPAVVPHQYSSPVSITLSNTSSLSMYMGNPSANPYNGTTTANSPAVDFSDAGFSIVSGTDTCTGKILAPNGSCTLSIQFSPTASNGGKGTETVSATMYATGVTDAVVLATATVQGSVPSAR